MTTIYLSLGSNIGTPKNQIKKALEELKKNGLKITKISSFYSTEPVGVKNQPWFINICVKAETNLKPQELFSLIKKTEKNLGRKTRQKWHQREIDIDILYYGKKIIQTALLQIPHQQIKYRNFVLIPLKEIAPNFRDPKEKKTIAQLLNESQDKSEVLRLKSYVSPPTLHSSAHRTDRNDQSR